jgi:hypothetical protein
MSQEKIFTDDDLAKTKKINEPQLDKAAGELKDEDLAQASGGGPSDFTFPSRVNASSPQ